MEAKFELAAEVIKKAGDIEELKKQLSNDKLLELYGWFKVATVGAVEGSRPGMFNQKGRAKFDSWTKCFEENPDQEAAKNKYVEIVSEMYPEDKW